MNASATMCAVIVTTTNVNEEGEVGDAAAGRCGPLGLHH